MSTDLSTTAPSTQSMTIAKGINSGLRAAMESDPKARAEAVEVFRKSRREGRCGVEDSCVVGMAVPFT